MIVLKGGGSVAFEVDPDSLRQAAAALALLPNEIEKAKRLDAGAAARGRCLVRRWGYR
ncbi:hypothetical protein [Nocardia farcinica]|uniref:hypothetical protein n=1 Tax=Nocardia farcinica TaxID=37329 RepID=UPI001895FEC8|nr:hypothetical protein [Nocardia farcinica]MBF6139934.1 hypothetical protein [Nocardia farcinica]MBF6384097.1 hypothetical protein [Nocardia farcinica]